MDLEAMPLADLERLQVRIQAEIDFKLMRMGEAQLSRKLPCRGAVNVQEPTGRPREVREDNQRS